MIRIVLDAGHGFYTAGKRCLKSIDTKETREWVLNNRIVTKVQNKLKEYDVDVLRVDDPTGITDISLRNRVNQANKFGADIYCSFHHNAGINGGTGGGISVITYNNGDKLVDIRNKLYNNLIDATELRGNRATPTYAASLYVLKYTNMNAVLVEHGFMDSTTDVPIILTEVFAEKCANGWIKFFEEYFGIKKKAIDNTDNTKYYPKYKGSSTKIDEVFKAIGVPNIYYGNCLKRKKIAEVNGIKLYSGTSSQNLALISKAKSGCLLKP